MHTMTVNQTEYAVVHLLGKGKGGYSWLVEKDGQLFVLKQIHHEPCSYYQFGDKLQSECQDYERLRTIGVPMPALIDVDVRQERLLKAYIDGTTADQLILRDALPDWCLPQLRDLCSRLYANGLNIDYFPTNFIPLGNTLYYVDYECNAYMQEWDFEHWGVKYWSKTADFLRHFDVHSDRR